MNKELFVQNVKKYCALRGVKPTVACRESGVSSSFISNIEGRNQTPSVEKVQMLAQYLGVTTSELLGEVPISSDPEQAARDALTEQLAQSVRVQLSEEKKPTPADGDGLNEEQLEVIRRYDAAPPALRAAALAVLRSAEEPNKVQGDGTTGK